MGRGWYWHPRNIKLMENISQHISYKEATRSNTANRLGIRNTPNKEQLGNMERLSRYIFEPLRGWVGGPIRINSFFRSTKLNTAVGGSKSSSHIKGQAIDIDDTHGHKTNAEMFHYIRQAMDFDALIWEFGNNKNPDWVHVSYVSQFQNRKQVLRAIRFTDRGGTKRTKYIPYA